jgi:hypothetical protein
MVFIDVNLMPLKAIGKKVCLWAKGPYGLLKILDPRSIQIFEGKMSERKQGSL